MDYQDIRYEVSDRILTLTLNRPDRLNAWTLRMRDEMLHALARANEDDDIGVIVVTGAGRVFCAGMELEREEGNIFGYDIPQGERLNIEEIRDSGGELSLALYRSKKPLIAAINGAAVGVGITMTLPMDFRIAAEGAKIGFVFSQRGIVPEACSSWFLPRLVGMQAAMEWVLSGEIFSAEEGLEKGLFRSLAPRDDVLGTAYALARKLMHKTSPVSLALARQMLWRNPSFEHPMQAHCVDSKLMYLTSERLDGRDGFRAFLEKRDPVFTAKVSESVPDQFDFWPEPPLA
ncbi:enoyl-CoA hydratase [Alcanivorax sp. S71-1-4]|jgi:enoyl-CoA hydratase/carnithine racemase|uniref:crotonase/enoyl-CoA hydratase family protein n=1 Tax=Alcanivorax sp. S71-1-4 TaxID=1177159 RepID=UPI0013589190|nr:crotonase/enoyl-CoA hydratase family protein [Alcanivorax sp. S71-1-4]KAF0810811.1 enoyl-CoA hydratase [Alcanivorax sp. S71-1-4]